MFIAVVVVVILGTVAIGGVSIIWNLNDLGGRLIMTKYTLNLLKITFKIILKTLFLVLLQICMNVIQF